jgi:putative acetyltransferase
MEIIVDDLTGQDIVAFLEEHLQEMRATSPPESVHALDLSALRETGITFWSVYDGGRLVGCGAMKKLDDDHAEVKSMRAASDRKRSGIASAVLEHIVREARAGGFSRLSLETGATPHFEPARKLYEKFGFEYCGPFADYRLDPHSVFMTRVLQPMTGPPHGVAQVGVDGARGAPVDTVTPGEGVTGRLDGHLLADAVDAITDGLGDMPSVRCPSWRTPRWRLSPLNCGDNGERSPGWRYERRWTAMRGPTGSSWTWRSPSRPSPRRSMTRTCCAWRSTTA